MYECWYGDAFVGHHDEQEMQRLSEAGQLSHANKVRGHWEFVVDEAVCE